MELYDAGLPIFTVLVLCFLACFGGRFPLGEKSSHLGSLLDLDFALDLVKGLPFELAYEEASRRLLAKWRSWFLYL